MKPITIIDAPSNLGLRPLRLGHEPGVWRGPQSLFAPARPLRALFYRPAEMAKPIYIALLQRLRSAGHGLGDIYQTDLSQLHLKKESGE